MLINTRCTKDYQYFLVDPTEDVLMNERKIWIFHAAFELDFRFPNWMRAEVLYSANS